jgi:hypothetical protein
MNAMHDGNSMFLIIKKLINKFMVDNDLYSCRKRAQLVVYNTMYYTTPTMNIPA